MSAPEHRLCPMTGAYVIVSPARKGATAHLSAEGGLPTLTYACPFCPGDALESEPVLALAPDHGPWQVRVLPNKFPAVVTDAPEGEHGPGAHGAHEIVIESRDHDGDLARYDDAHLTMLFRTMRARVRALEATPGIEHVSVFRNRGRRAGASQPHPHAQIIGTRLPGREQVKRLEVALRHYTRRGTSLLHDVLVRERRDGARVIADAHGMVSLAAFAPQRTGEAWVVPEAGAASLSALDDHALDAFARAIRTLARASLESSGRTDYNVILRTLPVPYRDHPAAFMYAEIAPRGGVLAGFEIATGAGLVSTQPEMVAETLRAQYARL